MKPSSKQKHNYTNQVTPLVKISSLTYWTIVGFYVQIKTKGSLMKCDILSSCKGQPLETKRRPITLQTSKKTKWENYFKSTGHTCKLTDLDILWKESTCKDLWLQYKGPICTTLLFPSLPHTHPND